jgi:hypothetical protein
VPVLSFLKPLRPLQSTLTVIAGANHVSAFVQTGTTIPVLTELTAGVA